MQVYTGEIYLITNIINGKKYVGQTTVGANNRWNRHIYNSKVLNIKCVLNNSIRKYGEENFSLEVLKCICSNSRFGLTKSLNSSEIKFIELFDSFNSGYNMNMGGGAMTGYKHTYENKKIASERMKNRVVSEETRQKLKMKVHSKSSKEKISLAHKGKPKSLDAINKSIKSRSKPVIQMDLFGNFINEFQFARLAEDATGVKKQNIHTVCKRNRGTAGKYKWMYKII